MAAIVWPTHKAKARARQNAKIYWKKKGRRIRRLYRDGKRGEL